MIGKLVEAAETSMEDVHALMLKAKRMEKEVQNAKKVEENRRKEAVRKERRWSAREKDRGE